MVGYILSSRFYTGDSKWQKTYTTDTIPFAQIRNHGQKPKYHVEDDHPGIISREDFRRVQELIAARVERLTVVPAQEVKLRLLNGLELTERLV